MVISGVTSELDSLYGLFLKSTTHTFLGITCLTSFLRFFFGGGGGERGGGSYRADARAQPM